MRQSLEKYYFFGLLKQSPVRARQIWGRIGVLPPEGVEIYVERGKTAIEIYFRSHQIWPPEDQRLILLSMEYSSSICALFFSQVSFIVSTSSLVKASRSPSLSLFLYILSRIRA